MSPTSLALVLSALVPAPDAPSGLMASSVRVQEPVASAPSDEELRRRFQKLPKSLRAEFGEAFRAEVGWLDTFQTGLLRFVLSSQPRHPDTWPELEPAPHFDPEVHAPGQARRKVLSENSSKVKKQRERFFSRIPEPRLQSAFVYDYATRELRRVELEDDAQRVFDNGLAGLPPELDLAAALVEMALDDGEQAVPLGAFGHAYTDRSGNVYPGITLYDAFASGLEIEMPDVDCLGVVHLVLDDWRTWKAPVPDRKHDAMYERIGELFQDAHRHRGLRHALAQCFLVGTPVLRDGYGANLDALHALWEEASSTPDELIAELPESARWRKFLDAWVKKVGRDKKLRASGEARRATLDANGWEVRRALVRVLTELEQAAARSK